MCKNWIHNEVKCTLNWPTHSASPSNSVSFHMVFICRPVVCLVFTEALSCEQTKSTKMRMKNRLRSHPAHWGRVTFYLIIAVLIDREWVATLISVGLKVLYPMVRMVVRGRIDPHRPAALHLTALFLFYPWLFHFSFFCWPCPYLLYPPCFHLHFGSIPSLLLSSPLFIEQISGGMQYLWINSWGLCVNSREQSGTGQRGGKQPGRAGKQSITWRAACGHASNHVS